ncbi:unnamed protein product, partial [Ceratitis capitata]
AALTLVYFEFDEFAHALQRKHPLKGRSKREMWNDTLAERRNMVLEALTHICCTAQ